MTPEEEAKKRGEEEVNQVLFKNPKKFVNGTRIFIAQGFFALRLDIGEQQETFALPPQVAKILSHFLSLQVSAYEANVAPIPFDLSTPSPIQASDLGKPDQGESTPPSTGSKPDKPSGKPKKK